MGTVANSTVLDYGRFIPPKSVRSFIYQNKLAANAIAVILGAIMLYVIKVETIYQIRRYRNILFINTIIDLTFSFLGLLACETVFIFDFHYFVVLEGIMGNLPQPWTAIFYSLMVFSMYMMLTIVPVQYVYRFFLICRNFCFDTYHLGVAVSISVAVSGYYALLWVKLLWPEPTDFQRFKKYLNNEAIRMPNGEIPSFGVGYFPLWNLIVCSCLAIIIVVYLIIFTTSICITITLRRTQSKMTKKTLKMQKQISYVLFFQALVPFITIVFPLILNFCMIDTGVILTLMTTWAPVLNPLVTLTVVTQYRNFVLNYFRRLKRKSVAISTATLSTYHS